MKKIIYTLFAIGVIFWGHAQNYDVNFRVTSRTANQIEVAIEAKTTTGTLDIGKTAGNAGNTGGYTQEFTFNTAAVTFNSGTIPSLFTNFDGTKTVTVTGGTVTAQALTGAVATTGNQTITLNTTYQTIATATFTIISTNQPLNFTFSTSTFTLRTGNGAGNVTTHVRNASFDKITFNGSWSGGNGTAGAPADGIADLCKQIEVTSGGAEIPTGQNVQCDYIDISGGSLTISPGASITAFNQSATSYNTSAANFILDAGSSGYAQFLGAPVALTARQYWDVTAGSRWINMGFPVAGNLSLGGAPINANGGTSAYCIAEGANPNSNIVPTTNIYEFTSGSNGCATPVTIEHEWAGGLPSAGTKGYNVFIGGGIFASTGIISGEGSSVNSASFAYTHATPHAGGTGSQGPNAVNFDGWRLVANPFTCNLNLDAFLADNPITSISVGTGGSYSTLTTGTIPPFQAFWIKTGSDGTLETIDFLPSHRSIGTASVAKTNTLDDHVALSVSNGTQISEAQLVFDPNTTKGYDQMYDGFTFINKGPNMPNIAFHYTYVANSGNYTVWSPMHMNYVPAPIGTESYPLLFHNTTSGNHTFNIDATVLPAGYQVFVEDLLTAPGVLNDITSNGYAFSHNANNADPLRFVLHVSNSTVGLEGYRIANNQITAWFNGNTLEFGNLEASEVSKILVTDITGRVIAKGTTLNPITVTTSGIYVVQLTNETGKTNVLKVVKR
jgi:hypothetical protein